MNRIRQAETEALRPVESARRHKHGRKADESMEQSDELRHRRHLNGAGPPYPNTSADPHREQDPQKREESPWQLIEESCRSRNRHAYHAETVALPSGFRRRQAAQGENEKHARGKIKQSCDISVQHRFSPFS